MSALPNQPLGTASRHSRVADAAIASYVRELLEDDPLDASPPPQDQRDALAPAQPAAARGRSAAAWVR